jgi:K+-transporting ATPase KdpF subunit
MNAPVIVIGLIGHMGGADVFGLVVSLIAVGYLFYALIRGERF